MRTTLRILFFLALAGPVAGQIPFKAIADKPGVTSPPFRPALDIPRSMNRVNSGAQYRTISFMGATPAGDIIRNQRITPNGSFWIDLKPNSVWSARSSLRDVVHALVPGSGSQRDARTDWQILSENADALDMIHLRLGQTLDDIPIYGQNLILHLRRGELESLNGYVWTGRIPSVPAAIQSGDAALEAARRHVNAQDVAFNTSQNNNLLQREADFARLIWLPVEGGLVQAYLANIHPNAMDHWTVFVHAGSLEIIRAWSDLCSFAPQDLLARWTSSISSIPVSGSRSDPGYPEAPPLDGATSTTDQDLFGIGRTVNAWQIGTTFFMVDASRTTMFNPAQSNMPNEPIGVIWTIDAQNTSPETSQFAIAHCTTPNNNWKPLEVSAHFNGGRAFEYFRQTFNRNSINGNGGNVISIINVAEANGAGLDNAFWSGQAMFYGNGNVAFQPLAKGLDVAGHEMSHGVVDNTANLEYVGQSGALNESFADVFGAMIDRDDWKIGEDVVKTTVFPSGALRDLQNPNNGGNSFGDNGWQPKHMNEFVNLPNTPQGDNGGVHVNSGIPNRAFFLLASAIGKDKAEQIYYRALVNYLVKSSQFIDMRLAAERAAGDLHGSTSPEVNAVKAAFDGVGIGTGAGGDYEVDLEPSPGTDYILVTDEQESDLYWVPPANPAQLVKLNVPAPLTRPSFTDDGAACVYVDQDQDLILLQFDWTFGLDYGWNYLEANPSGSWRNIVVAKDGSKIAFTTAQLRDEILVYDFGAQANQTFGLYNPTTAPGGLNAGDVLYADAMEWDYDGQVIIYDALNRINSTFGNAIEYWNISYLDAWNKAGEDFGSGQIGNIFSGLPENVSVGNPSLAKNSPYIMAFDYLETVKDAFGQEVTDFRILAANLETGDVGEIAQNNTVGYPCYSKLDNKVLFTFDDNGSPLVATVDLAPDKMSPVPGSEVAVVLGAQKGVWFLTGERDLSAADDPTPGGQLIVHPQPAADWIEVTAPSLIDGSYEVMDGMGRPVDAGRMDNGSRIGIAHLPAGIYLVRIMGADGRIYRTRFVKA